MHDASVVQMGSTKSSERDVDNRKGTIAAGLAVHLKSDDTISVAAADGSFLGISLGRSLSNTARTAICRSGLGVPIQLSNGFTPVKGAQVNISDTTGKAIAAGAGATAVNATYVSGVLTGIDEDGNELADGAALIDMVGGL